MLPIFLQGGTGFDSTAAGFLMGVVLVFIFQFVAAMKVHMGVKPPLVATFFLGTFGRRGDAVLSRIDPCSRGLRVHLLPHQLQLMFHKARQGDTLFKLDYCKYMLLLHERGAFRIDMQWGSCAGTSAKHEYSQSLKCGSTITQ